MNQLITVREAAHRIRVTTSYVYQLIKDERITSPLVVRVGKAYRVDPYELEKWISAGANLHDFDNPSPKVSEAIGSARKRLETGRHEA